MLGALDFTFARQFAADIPELSPLLGYELTPLYIAVCIVILIFLWFGLVFWLTRRKPAKVLSTLPPKEPMRLDNSAIKREYLIKIDALEKSYLAGEIRERKLHQALSLVLREFVSKVENAPVLTMTLKELRQTRHARLIPVIESYYRPEFQSKEQGDAASALMAARKVVGEWS